MSSRSLMVGIPKLSRLTVPLFGAGCLLAAVLVGHHAYRITYDSPYGFDEALPWYGAAFILLILAASNRGLLNVAAWPARTARYLRAHPIETTLLLTILAMGAFLRLWKYGTLPPSNFLCCEEDLIARAATEILDGAATSLNYPTVHYSAALGLLIFGDNADGLRLPFVIIGIAAIVPFYLLMRELVQVPAALFATALFASLRVLGDLSWQLQPGIFISTTFALALIRGMKTGNPLWWIASSFLAALLSYEYEAFKMVPLAAGIFVLAAFLVSVFWPRPWIVRAVGSRAWALAKRAWLPAVFVIVASAIAFSPMFARRHHGEHIYFASFNRQHAGRTETGLARYFSPKWKDQLKWVAQIYTPFVEVDFPLTGSIDARGVIDRGTSVFLWAGTLAAVVGFWRPWRLLFLIWFAGGSLALALLVENFTAWKTVGFLLPGIVLVGLFVDDLWRWLNNRYPLLMPGLVVGLLVAVAFVFTANTLIVNGNASDPGVLAAYSVPDSETFSTCLYLRTRPKDNHTYWAEWALGRYGFTMLRNGQADERFAWQSQYLVCKGLQGSNAASGEELWPPFPPKEGPATIALTGGPEHITIWRRALERAMPGVAEPAFKLEGPNNSFQVVGYELPPGYLDSWRGLWATYRDNSGQLKSEVINPEDVSLESLPDGTEVQLRGLVLVPDDAQAGWTLTISGAEAAVRVDGTTTFSSLTSPEQVAEIPLFEGWHVVDATIRLGADADKVYFLRRSHGEEALPVSRDEFFALPDANGWQHIRSFGDNSGPSKFLSRFDFDPHLAREEQTLPLASTQPPEAGWKFYDDVWTAIWHVPADGAYNFAITSAGSDIQLSLDGTALETSDPYVPGATAMYRVPVTKGDHRLEIRFRLSQGPIVGGQLRVSDDAGVDVKLNVTPY